MPFSQTIPLGLPQVSRAGPELIPLSNLHSIARGFIRSALSPNTVRSYDCAWRKFGTFCNSHSIPLFPVLVSSVSAFLTLNFKFNNLSYSYIHSLVAGIQFHARLNDYAFPSLFTNPHISLLLRGFRNASVYKPDKHLPLTLNILHNLIILLRNGVFTPYLDSLFR